MTNYERIKNMGVDEIIELLIGNCFCCVYCDDIDCRHGNTCGDGIVKWLESEVEGDG